jgi:protein-tyrosine-phosphatase
VKNVLFLCTGNSARSILAEAYLNHVGKGSYRAFSAGSQPGGRVNPFSLSLLKEKGIPTGGARSKSWDEFAAPDAPRMDLVVTVCDSAAGEVCPVWPGAPSKAHWGVDDPAAVQGSDAEKRAAFERAFCALKAKIDAFLDAALRQQGDKAA